jgi:hypothetical protein
MKIYFAARARFAPWVAAIEQAGLNLHSDWHTHNLSMENESPDTCRVHSERCIKQASESSVCLLVLDGENFGSLLECGAVLNNARGYAYVVGTNVPNFLKYHPRVRTFTSLSLAVQSLIAQQEATKARGMREQTIRDLGEM